MTEQPLRVDRFARRSALFADRAMRRIDVRFRRLQEIPQDPTLREYLYTAALDILCVDSAHAVRARIVHFPESTFVHTLVPRITVVWRRDKLSIGRALVLLVKNGELSFEDPAQVITRRPGVYLVPPGDAPVRLSAQGPHTELVYFSIPARFVRDVLADPQRVPAEVLPFALFAPMYAFMANLCGLSVSDIDDPTPLQTASEEISRSVVRLILGAPERPAPTLFSTTVKLILDGYASRTLNSDRLAERLGVSPRTLQLAFRSEGTTVAATIRRVRTAAAARLRKERPQLTRARVAELTGFGSVDALDRAWRASLTAPARPQGREGSSDDAPQASTGRDRGGRRTGVAEAPAARPFASRRGRAATTPRPSSAPATSAD